MGAIKTLKKLHKWPGIIIAFLLLYYGVTGIFMNHREPISRFDVDRNVLPKEFRYHNWNNGALKGNLILTSDSILVYGNIGIWLTDSTFQSYTSFNKGFPKGVDNRKIFDVHRSADGHLYAATQFGLYDYNSKAATWNALHLNTDIKRFVAIESIDDTLYALNRSYLFKGKSAGINTWFEKIEFDRPNEYQNKISVFKTIWQIHSGEILGLPGRLFVDLLGLLTIFMSLTGIIYFLFPRWIKRRKKKKKAIIRQVNIIRWSLIWHNKTGSWFLGFIIVLFFSGMFLRPPLLIAIARMQVAPIKYSHLDQANPWYDKLRDLLYDEEDDRFLLSTSDGMYSFDRNNTKPIAFGNQPPVSVMGITTLEHDERGTYLIGSFSGLFLWNPKNPKIYDYVTGQLYRGATSGRPVGQFKATGLLTNMEGKRYLLEYDQGVIPLWHSTAFPKMPQEILKASGMSLWNLSLEIHTGRFFRFLLNNFYILLVPLSGLISIMVLISGYLIYIKKHKN